MNRREALLLLGASSLLGVSGCSIFRDGSKGGYHGPEHLKWHTIDAVDSAIKAFAEHYGLHLKWDRHRRSLTVKTVPVVKTVRGIPLIASPNPAYPLVGAYYLAGTYTIVVPETGLQRDSLVHEAGHFVLHINGYGAGHDHHDKYHWFFMQRFQYGGGPVL